MPLHTPEEIMKMRQMGLLKGEPLPGEAPGVGDVSREELNYFMNSPAANYPSPQPPPDQRVINPADSAVKNLDADLSSVQTYAEPREETATSDENLVSRPTATSIDDLYDDSAYSEAFDQMSKARQLAGAAGILQADAETKHLQKLQANLEQKDKDDRVRDIARKKSMEESQRKLDKSVAAFESAKIDPKRLWTSMSNGQKVMTGIALAFGAFGSISGGPNRAADMITKAVDDDIALQRAEIAQLGNVVTAKRSLLQDMRAMFDDDRQAEAAAKLAMINQAELALKTEASRYKSPAIQANTIEALGQLQLKKEELRSKFAESAALMAIKQGKAAGNIPENLAGRYVEGYGLAPTEREGIDFRTQIATAKKVKNNVNELLSMIDKGGEVNAAMRADASTIATFLKGALRLELVGPGTVSAQDQKILDSIVANPTSIFNLDSQSRASLNRILQVIDNGLSATAESMGMRPQRAQVRERNVKA